MVFKMAAVATKFQLIMLAAALTGLLLQSCQTAQESLEPPALPEESGEAPEPPEAPQDSAPESKKSSQQPPELPLIG